MSKHKARAIVRHDENDVLNPAPAGFRTQIFAIAAYGCQDLECPPDILNTPLPSQSLGLWFRFCVATRGPSLWMSVLGVSTVAAAAAGAVVLEVVVLVLHLGRTATTPGDFYDLWQYHPLSVLCVALSRSHRNEH